MFRRIVRRLALPLAALVFLAVLLALPADLLARAGGGEGYSGGRRGGGGSGGGGGDGGFVIYLIVRLFELCFYYPAVGVPILLIVLACVGYVWFKGRDTYQSSVIRRATADRDVRRQPSIAAEVRGRDPQFDPEVFLGRVREAFLKIQQAWAGQDLSAVRPFISDAVHERFGLQFEEQKALGYRNRMDRVTVQRATLAEARSDALFDELAVRIQASAVDQKVRLADGGVVSGSASPQTFVEVWSFLRRRGATSHPEKPGLMEGCCPNCGAAVAMNQSANCQYCGALLRSGLYDWVLVEITQEYEWERRDRASAPGVDAVRARDPEFNPQELEDRASVVFWRRTAAERVNSVKPIRKVATDAFADAFERRTRATAGNPRTYHGECAVGAVNLLGVLPAGDGDGAVPDDGQDRALVEVRWSGWRFTAFPDGRPPARGEQSAVVHSLLVLARRADARSNPDQSVASAHCPTCGAPEAGGTDGACQYCGTVLNDGRRWWSLEEETTLSSPRGQSLVAPLGAQASAGYAAADDGDGHLAPAAPPPAGWGPPRELPGQSVVAWMVKMTLADGRVDDRERALLTSAAKRYRVPAERVDAMIAAAAAGELNLPEPADADEARRHLANMARAALADGTLSGDEYALLRTSGQRLGLSDHDVKQLLRRTKAEMFAEARGENRAARAAVRNGSGG